jgi:hypothetical protein
MTKPTPLQRALVGPAGEHYVIFRLYREGMLASLAPPGFPTVDVLVLAPDQRVIASLQVKTRTYGKDKGWHMSLKHESMTEPGLFYAFVDLEPELPVAYIVPSGVVADVLKKSHQAWLITPGAKGQQRNDGPMRRIQPTYRDEFAGYSPEWLNEWRERWDLLKAAAAGGVNEAHLD